MSNTSFHDHSQNFEQAHSTLPSNCLSYSSDGLTILDATPTVKDLDTPNVSSDISFSEDSSSSADDILKEMRVKNVNRVIIGTLNLNSLAAKFEQLREVIGKNIDILTIQETKLDSSFPSGQFLIDGYSEPYRLDRNRNGGGVMIYEST